MTINEPVITFNSYEILNLSVKNADDTTEKERAKQNLATNFGLTKDLGFARVTQTLDCFDKNSDHQIHLVMAGYFIINDLEAGEERIKQYVTSNANAILYPYVRSVVSVISTLASSKTTILPTLRFNGLIDQSTAEQESGD